MNRIQLSLIGIACTLSFGVAAAETKDGKQPQSNRMSQCSTEAKDKGMKGEARKEYMSQCLRTGGTQSAAKVCAASADEKGLKGAPRKDFVAECVRSKSAGGVG